MHLTIRKSNDLVEVGEDLSKPAKLFVLYLIAIMPDDETELREIVVSYKELKRIVNIDGKRRISTLKEAERMMDELDTNPLRFENAEIRDTVTWFSRKRYYKKRKVWQFRFHEELKPYLLHLKNHFTMYNFWYTVCLSSHAIKFYELMKRYEYLGKCEIPVERQKYFLGIEEKYLEYYEYRRWVLDEVQKELAIYTDIAFNYKPAKKQGRKIISHQFFIEKNIPKVVPEPLKRANRQAMLPFKEEQAENTRATAGTLKEQYPDLFDKLRAWGGKENTILGLITAHGIEKILYQFRHTKRMLEEKKITSKQPFGWFRSALKGNYADRAQEAHQKKSKTKKKKEQRDQRIEILEIERKKLLNEYIHKRKALCDVLIKEEPTLLDKLFTQIREKYNGLPIVFSSAIKADPEKATYAAAQWYEEKSFVFVEMMQLSSPAAFEELLNEFRSKVQIIEQDIRKKGGRVSVFNWG